jgi:hypothetical protein
LPGDLLVADITSGRCICVQVVQWNAYLCKTTAQAIDEMARAVVVGEKSSGIFPPWKTT